MDLLVDRQRPPGVFQRPRQIPLVFQNQADVVDPDRHLGMLGAIDLLADRQRPLIVLLRLIQFGSTLGVYPELVQ